MTIKVVPIQPEDIPVLWRLEEEIWTEDNAPNISEKVEYSAYAEQQKDRNILVAKENGELLGFIAYHHPTRMAAHNKQWTFGIGVAEKAQGKGVGKKLIHTLFEEAKKQGVEKISLRVMGTNPKARAFYEHLGFVQEGHSKKEFWINGQWIEDYHYAYYL